MKIGILTYHAACNFGANLQILSTIGYLKRLHHEPLVINYQPAEMMAMYRRKTPQNVYKAFDDFRNKYMPLTDVCRCDAEIAKQIEKHGIESVIIGSDAVAQHHPLLSRIKFPTRHVFSVAHYTDDRLFPNPFWGTFAKYLRKEVSMAIMSASCQNSEYNYFLPSVKNQMHECLRRMRYISARDMWTQLMYANVSSGEIKVDVTPDPVFGFNQNMDAIVPSKEEVLSRYGLPDKYILVSFWNNNTVTQEWLDVFEKKANEQGMAVVAMPFPQGMLFKNQYKYSIPSPLLPHDWYALIKYSCGYVGHNMHPIISSLHNNVPFFSFDNWGSTRLRGLLYNEKSSKIYLLLHDAGFMDNRIRSKANVNIKPEAVLDRLLDFDKEKAKVFAEKKYEDYNRMMQDILQSLQ